MNNDNIKFDDWITRYPKALEKRRKDYIICEIPLISMCLFSTIFMFFEFAFVVVLILFIIVTVVVYLEWLKVKNNHLVIRTNQIEITNRFSKKVIYNIDYNNLKIKLERSCKRGGGILLSFYDSNFNYITRYEDMLNYPTPYGEKRNCWEETIKTLGLEIIDNSEIIKN